MTIQEIKKYFFTFRDGNTADVLKRGGVPCKIVFGLQIPQLSVLAKKMAQMEPDDREELAKQLWADRDVRESRLLACYLFDPARVSFDDCHNMALDVRSQEEADMLAFRLLRHTPFVQDLYAEIEPSTPVAKALQRMF